MESHEYISNVRAMKMRKKDKEVKVNKKYNHAKTAKPIMKESQIHKGDDCNGKKLESKFLWNGNCD